MEQRILHDIQSAQGAEWAEEAGRQVVRSFGDWRAEYDAARSTAVIHDASDRDWLRVTGDDRVSFLHGMVTNDVKGLPLGRATYVAMLTPKGAMVGDARLWHRPNEIWLDVEPGLGGRVKQFLDEHLISEEAEVHVGELALLGVHGPRAQAVLAAIGFATLPAENETRERAELLAVGANGVLPGAELLVPRSALNKLYSQLLDAGRAVGARPIGDRAWDTIRVESGIPLYGRDMDEKTIPLEANLERAIHYQKGCYIGQEVIARATFRGHVNRKLTGVLLGTGEPAPRTELRKGERKAGWITSVVESPAKGQRIGLAYVQRDFLDEGTVLELPSGTATVHPLPFVPR